MNYHLVPGLSDGQHGGYPAAGHEMEGTTALSMGSSDSRQHATGSGCASVCGGIEACCFEAEGAVSSVNWQYVGVGKGNFEKQQQYSYVGDGQGSYEQEEIVTYYGWKIRPCCVGVILCSLIAGALVWCFRDSLTDRIDEYLPDGFDDMLAAAREAIFQEQAQNGTDLAAEDAADSTAALAATTVAPSSGSDDAAPTALPFNCYSKEAMTTLKATWCCAHAQLFCDAASSTTQGLRGQQPGATAGVAMLPPAATGATSAATASSSKVPPPPPPVPPPGQDTLLEPVEDPVVAAVPVAAPQTGLA